ncbi:MAG: GNAT family N-acetyltransferase [Fimbriimonadaceae bacterium]|nr:GNAT family N-acetyltransferase [Fimbriimonadaceae bacterium]
MSLPELSLPGRNLWQTTPRLAAAAGATVGSGRTPSGMSYVQAVGDLSHPIANYLMVATDGAPHDWGAIEAAQGYLYVLLRPGSSLSTAWREQAHARRWMRLYRLAQMVHPEPTRTALAWPEVERSDAVRLMMETFFGRHATEDQAAIAGCYQRVNMPMVGTVDSLGLAAAAMVSPTEESVGIYNLCVPASRRRLGHGGSLVKLILQASGGRPVTLQCEPSLVPWYERFGFRSVDFVEIYAMRPKDKAKVL